jgi:hypothetical protein
LSPWLRASQKFGIPHRLKSNTTYIASNNFAVPA